MGDLTEIQASQSVKVVGASGSNFMDVDSNNNAKTVNNNAGGASAVNVQDGGNSLTVDTPQLASTLGQKNMAGSAAVVIASDQSLLKTQISDGTNSGSVSPNGEVDTSDILDHGGTDTVLSVTAGTPKELKVGGSVLANRKYVIFEALGTGVKWGFSNTTQSFDLFKSQLVMFPAGPSTHIWFSSATGTVTIAIGEVA